MLAQWDRLRRTQSCLQTCEGLSLGRGNEPAVWPRGVNCQDQAEKFWTGEISKGTEDSTGKGHLKEGERAVVKLPARGGPSKAPRTSSDYKGSRSELRGTNGL